MSDISSVTVDPLLLQSPLGDQNVLFVEIHRDDAEILRSENGDWLRVLKGIDRNWVQYRLLAAQYYQSLFEFNREQAQRRAARARSVQKPNSETREEAEIRLLQERPTGGNANRSTINPVPSPPSSTPSVNMKAIAPGIVPPRLAGRPPKDFFSLVKAFIGVQAMGRSSTAEEVHHHLVNVPPLRRACGFKLPEENGRNRSANVPRLRKLEQFDEIMTSRGLWDQVKVQVVTENLEEGRINLKGQVLVHDTTHYVAYSSLDVVEIPSEQNKTEEALTGEKREDDSPDCEAAERDATTAKMATVKGKSERKSQSRVTKNCRCQDRENCPHEWVLADEGAGTVVKGQGATKRRHWAHKAAVLSTGPDGAPLDARAMTDAASHDSTGLIPHLRIFFAIFPALIGVFTKILADAAYDGVDLTNKVLNEFQLLLKTQLNPRNRKTLVDGLPRGMAKLSPWGTLTCIAGEEMQYLGYRRKSDHFLYGPPSTADGEPVCGDCHLRQACCRGDTEGGRYPNIPVTMLPHIDHNDPKMAKRFKAIMRHRTSVERAIKRLKHDMGDDRLRRRGNDAFQAHLDKSLIAFHLLLRLD